MLYFLISCRQHVDHPPAFSSDEDADSLREDACITLLYGELFLDSCLQNKTRWYDCSSDESGVLKRKEPTTTKNIPCLYPYECVNTVVTAQPFLISLAYLYLIILLQG
jgi:hypothetical protein